MDIDRKTNFINTETARCYAAQAKYHEAIDVLERVDGCDDGSDLGRILLSLEVYVQLGREIKASKFENLLRACLCRSPWPQGDLVDTLADGYYQAGIGNCVKAMVVRKLLVELHQFEDKTAEEKFSGIASNLHQCSNVVREILQGAKKATNENAIKSLLKKFRNDDGGDTSDELDTHSVLRENKVRLFTIAMDYGLEYMKEMYDVLKQMSGVDWSKRSKDLAGCANSIGFQYCVAGDNQNSIRWRRNGIKVMEDQYGSQAKSYNLFGDLHHNIGVCLYNLNQFVEAKEVYERAIEFYQIASDYPVAEMREKDLQKSRSDLNDTKKHL